ncbi:MAG TPA: hypothetical protein VN449_10020 [Gaiellaceae bacterium]|nr:hypothetical protein [Gaiellaceae bacterium]
MMGTPDPLVACAGTCSRVDEWDAAAALGRETVSRLSLPSRRPLIGFTAGGRRTVIDSRPLSADATAATEGLAGRTVTPGSAGCWSGSEGTSDEPASGPAVAPVVGWAGWDATAGSGELGCSGAGGAGAAGAGGAGATAA